MDAGWVSEGSPVARFVALALATLAVATLALASRADAFVYWTNADGSAPIGRANLDGSTPSRPSSTSPPRASPPGAASSTT